MNPKEWDEEKCWLGKSPESRNKGESWCRRGKRSRGGLTWCKVTVCRTYLYWLKSLLRPSGELSFLIRILKISTKRMKLTWKKEKEEKEKKKMKDIIKKNQAINNAPWLQVQLPGLSRATGVLWLSRENGGLGMACRLVAVTVSIPVPVPCLPASLAVAMKERQGNTVRVLGYMGFRPEDSVVWLVVFVCLFVF